MANPSVVVDFVANTSKLVAGVKELGGAAGQAGAEVRKTDWKKIALWGAGAAAVGAGVKFVKDATTATVDLAKGTMQLQRVTGMDTKTASEWVTVLKSRGISTETFSKSMVMLSKQMTASADGSAKSSAAFKELGVNMADVRAGNTQAVLMQAADGLSKMSNKARRAALTQQLFGRSSSQLTPLLYAGSDAIQEQLNMADKYGATLGDKTTGNVKDLIANQREMGIAMDGVKVKIGVALLPVILQLSQVLVDVVRVMQPLLSNSVALKAILGTLAVAIIAYKVATLAATIAQLGLDAAMLPTIGIVLAVVAAVAALVAVGILVYKNWDTISAALGVAFGAIKSAAMDVFGWIKANWPLLVGILAGPLGVAVALVVTHWDTVKRATSAAWSAVTSALGSALSVLRSLVSGFTSWFSGAWAVVQSVMQKVAGWFAIPTQAAHAMVSGIESAVKGLVSFLGGVADSIGHTATRIANALRAPLNAVIGGWNSLTFTFPTVTIPKFPGVKVKGHEVVPGFGGESFGGQSFPFPKIPRLASGGVFDIPTLAIVGDSAGREIVTPEALLRQIVASMTPQVRVYIGDTELRELVRVEAVAVDNATAAALLGGVA